MDERTPETHPEGRAGIFLGLVRNYWSGTTRLEAWSLAAMLLVLVLVSVWIQALVNRWNAAFFDALEKRAQADIGPLLWQFSGYVVAAGIVMVATVLVRMYLQVQVRRSVTRAIYSHWLDSRAYLSLDRNARGAETPEFRIADDVRLAIDQLVDLAVGLFSSVILAITFFEVLARVGGSIRLDALGLTIPAYFLVAAVIYAFFVSGLTSLVGWPLVGRIQRKNHLEGEFRYQLMKVRENARSIADGRSEQREHSHLSRALDDLVAQWRRVLVAQARVSGVASSNAVVVGLVPVILSIPKYMTGEMSLGAVMQLATAFVQVQMALNWIVDNFIRVAELRASANRVGELVAAMDRHDDAAMPAMTAPSDALPVAARAAD